MNPTDSKSVTHKELDGSVERAEDAVQSSIARFETAMGNLGELVEGTTHKIQHVREFAHNSKEKLKVFTDEVKATIDPFVPYVKQVGRYSAVALGTLRYIPRPALWVVAGMIGYAAYRFLRSEGTAEKSTSLENTLSTSEFPYQ